MWSLWRPSQQWRLGALCGLPPAIVFGSLWWLSGPFKWPSHQTIVTYSCTLLWPSARKVFEHFWANLNINHPSRNTIVRPTKLISIVDLKVPSLFKIDRTLPSCWLLKIIYSRGLTATRINYFLIINSRQCFILYVIWFWRANVLCYWFYLKCNSHIFEVTFA